MYATHVHVHVLCFCWCVYFICTGRCVCVCGVIVFLFGHIENILYVARWLVTHMYKNHKRNQYHQIFNRNIDWSVRIRVFVFGVFRCQINGTAVSVSTEPLSIFLRLVCFTICILLCCLLAQALQIARPKPNLMDETQIVFRRKMRRKTSKNVHLVAQATSIKIAIAYFFFFFGVCGVLFLCCSAFSTPHRLHRTIWLADWMRMNFHVRLIPLHLRHLQPLFCFFFRHRFYQHIMCGYHSSQMAAIALQIGNEWMEFAWVAAISMIDW